MFGEGDYNVTEEICFSEVLKMLINTKKKIVSEQNRIPAASEELKVLSVALPGKKGVNKALQRLRKVDVKKACVISGGAIVALSAVSLTGRYTFYRGIVSGELKKQLATVNRKLDDLKEQNEALQAEISELKKTEEAKIEQNEK